MEFSLRLVVAVNGGEEIRSEEEPTSSLPVVVFHILCSQYIL